MRRRLPALLTALLLGFGCAYAVACGESDEGLLSSGRAEGIQANLDDINRFVEQGNCGDLGPQIEDLQRQVAELPAGTDRELRDRLQEGVDNLARVAPAECAEGDTPTQTDTQPTETTPPPTETQTQPTETTPPPTDTTPTQPTETTPPPTETTPPPETTPTLPPDSPPGGEEAPSGAAGDTG